MKTFERNRMCNTKWNFKGSELIQKIITPNLIRIRDEGFAYRDGELEVLDMEFSKAIRKQADIMENLEEYAEDFLKLFRFVESEKNLRLPMIEGSDLKSFIPFEETSGMTLLNLFSKGMMSLKLLDDNIALVSCDTVFFEGMEHAEEVIGNLMDAVFRFAGEERILTIERTSGKLVKTDVLGRGMRITYEYSFDYEKQLKEALLNAVRFAVPHPETKREENARKHRESILGQIKTLMDDINNEEGEKELSETFNAETAGVVIPEVLRDIVDKEDAGEPEKEVTMETEPITGLSDREETGKTSARTEEHHHGSETGALRFSEMMDRRLDNGEKVDPLTVGTGDYAGPLYGDPERFSLKSGFGVIYDKDDYGIVLPDGYDFADNKDGHQFVLWRGADRTPGKLQDAIQYLADEGEYKDAEAKPETYKDFELFGDYPVETRSGIRKFRVSIKGVAPEDLQKAKDFAKELTALVKAD